MGWTVEEEAALAAYVANMERAYPHIKGEVE